MINTKHKFHRPLVVKFINAQIKENDKVASDVYLAEVDLRNFLVKMVHRDRNYLNFKQEIHLDEHDQTLSFHAHYSLDRVEKS
jgi:hypothetical protein